ncbi:hypothetical protein [Nocardia sp. NPDC005366]|uniref:hypothetical protein n=1 Tax=Nocardia sp. NPDC005366 TaxID=3156878 RepID=UPI0033B1E7D2
MGAALPVVVGDGELSRDLGVIGVPRAVDFGKRPAQCVEQRDERERGQDRLIQHKHGNGGLQRETDQQQQPLSPAHVGDQGVEHDAECEQRRMGRAIVEQVVQHRRAQREKHATGRGAAATYGAYMGCLVV